MSELWQIYEDSMKESKRKINKIKRLERQRQEQMKKDNIVLIGMPGVGKSTVGVILAKILGYQFVDADLVIQKEEGKLLKDIIAEKGTDGFIQVENRVNSNLQVHESVVATGGSVVYGTHPELDLRLKNDSKR